MWITHAGGKFFHGLLHKSLLTKDKVLGQDVHWDIRDPDVAISRTKTLCKWPFSVVLDKEWPGYPGIWVGTPEFGKALCKRTLG